MECWSFPQFLKRESHRTSSGCQPKLTGSRPSSPRRSTMALTRKSMPLTVPEQPRAHLSAPEDPLRQMLTTLVQETLEREFTRIVHALCGARVSASEVSAVVKQLDGELATWRSRSLSGQAYPYLVFDAHVEQVRREGEVRATAMLWVIGIRADGYREHLGTWLGASESAESWNAVLEDLVRRGLKGVRYAVSDEHQGLMSALRRFFPEAAHQRCQVHYLRNALSKLSSPTQQHELLAALRDVWSAPAREEAEARLSRLVARLKKPLPRLAEWLEETAPPTLESLTLPSYARRLLNSTNSIEHDHAEVR